MSNWGDLRARILSAVVMIAVAVGAFMAGATVFKLLICVVIGLMIWELLQMLVPRIPQGAILAGVVVAGLLVVRALTLPVSSHFIGISLAAAAALATMGLATRDKSAGGVYAFAVVLAGDRAITMVGNPQLEIILLGILGIVILTDVAGYFAGRMFGGPKFWPSISPKKTWSGIVAGWVASLAVAPIVGIKGMGLLGIVLLSFASQLGDIAESAMKRRAGVKDSSNLIPGHGGFLDRFDGVIGALFVAAIVSLFL